MKINEKIKRIRELKGWTQEQIAEKLNMSISGYSNIERGGTNIQFTRLEQIAKILEMELSELVDLDERNIQIFLLQGNDNVENHVVTIHSSDIQLKHELEKAHLTIAHQQKEIEYQQKENLHLNEENNRLKEIIELMKKND